MNHRTRVEDPPADRRILVIEDHEELGAPVAGFVTGWGGVATRLTMPTDELLRAELDAAPDTVVVVSRDDIVALRYALLIEHIKPGIRLVVTIFDHTAGGEIARTVPNCTVVSMTEAIMPSLLAGCLHPELAAIFRIDNGLVGITPDAQIRPVRHIAKQSSGNRRARLRSWFGSLDVSARCLVLSFLGLSLAYSVDAVLGRIALHEAWPDALWNSARTLTTVGTTGAADEAPTWYKLASTVIMLAVLALVGLFTASLVDRVTGQRLTAILGVRALPRHGHVIVVGLGQVGLRLCIELRRLGVAVAAVERDRDARCLPLAKAARLPVVIGRGGDRFLLQRLNITSARALAAVASDPLENIAVAVTTRAVAPDQRIVLRAGGDDVVAESRSLFRIGVVCDVPRIIGAVVACHATGKAPRGVFLAQGRTYALFTPDSVVDLSGWEPVPRTPSPITETTSGTASTPS